jgi:hypothetical protein
VILSVGRHDVDSAEEADERLSAAGSDVRLLVRTADGSTRWVFLERAADD